MTIAQKIIPTLALSIPEAMESMGLSRATIYLLINTGQLRTYCVGTRRFTRPDYIKACQDQLAEKTELPKTAAE